MGEDGNEGSSAHLGCPHQASHAGEFGRQWPHHSLADPRLDAIRTNDETRRPVRAVGEAHVARAVGALLYELRALGKGDLDASGLGRIAQDLLEFPPSDADALELGLVRQLGLLGAGNLRAIMPLPPAVHVFISSLAHGLEQLRIDVAEDAKAVGIQAHRAASVIPKGTGGLIHLDVLALQAAMLLQRQGHHESADARPGDQHRCWIVQIHVDNAVDRRRLGQA